MRRPDTASARLSLITDRTWIARCSSVRSSRRNGGRSAAAGPPPRGPPIEGAYHYAAAPQ